MKNILNSSFIAFSLLLISILTACSGNTRESRLDQYHAEKHVKDSIALIDQERTLAFFQVQRDSLLPVVDSLIPLFKYEQKDPKYQDHGYYVANGRDGLRILVRDDGKDLLMYRNGTHVDVNKFQLKTNDANFPLFERAQHLQIVMLDINELERRILHTSLEVQKYQKRLSE